jgi:ubiquinone/menaquinone biosynthesis C-methylase UbiE
VSGWTKKRRLMKRYDLTASMYDLRYADEQKAKIEAALDSLKDKWFGLVLDVGCGTGILFDYVTDRLKMIVGLDLSKKTLLEAKTRMFKKNMNSVHLVQADADNMPFGDGVFNQVLAITVLQNAPNPGTMLREIRRVADDDAIFVLTGLKSIFSKRRFEQVLKEAGLKLEKVEEDDLKCYVAICGNSCR